MTKKPTLIEAVSAAACVRKKPKNWYERLPQEQQKELDEIKRAWNSGEIQSAALTLATAIRNECAERGIPTAGIEGIRKWLKDD